MKNIKVSIITPCYNSEKTIEKTLLSVLNQTYQNYEYIIIDGGSVDGTLDIVRKYAEQFEGKLHLISEKDNGIYDAMNKGVGMATGELIGIVNSDDWYEADAIENILDKYSGAEYEVVYGMLRNINLDGEEKSVVFYNHIFLEEKMINHPTCFITRQTYEDFGKYSTEYKSSADYAYLLKLMDSKKVVFTPIYKIISNFRVGGMSASMTGYRETLKIKLDRGVISKKKYYFLMAKSRLRGLFH